MADIYRTQASPNWEIESADVVTNQHNIHDRNFDSKYVLTGASSATKRLWIDRLSAPISGSYDNVNTVVISMYSGSYVNWANAYFVIHQNVVPSMTGRISSFSGSLDTLLDKHNGLFVCDLQTNYTLRYIQIEAVNMPVDPQITQVMLLRKHTTSRNHSIKNSHQFPRWYTNVTKLDGSRTLRKSNMRTPIQVFRRFYPLYGAVDITQAYNIVNECVGQVEPFIYTDGLSNDTYICIMSKDEPNINDIEQDHYEMQIEFEELYRIQSGYTY